MINAEFYLKDETLVGFSIKGHAGFADYGHDIVCSAVTSAVEMCSNGITEILKADATVGVFENEIRLSLNGGNKSAVDFIKALRLHLELLSLDYPQNIHLIDMEV